MAEGRVEGIYIKSEPGALPSAVDEVKAMEGVGLQGDPYASGDAPRKPGPGRQITLVAREALEELAADGHVLTPGESRRQIETRGIDLNALIGKRFRVGEAECIGVKECAPCKHLEKMTGKPVLRGLHGKGGLRGDIVSTGVIRVGDSLVPLD